MAKRLSSRVSLFAALGLGLLVLAWGLVWLQGIFLEERDEALAEVAARRRALEQFALIELEQRLRAQLDETKPTIDAAREDPLLPAGQFMLYDRGELVLPRQSHPLSGSGAPVSAVYLRLQQDPASQWDGQVDDDEPWNVRVQLLVELKQALEAGDREAIEGSFRDLLAHRAAFVMATERDLPTMLVGLEMLQRQARPRRELMAGLLRDGLTGQTSRLDGAQRQLLKRVDRFTSKDLRYLADRIIALCEAHSVLYSDFSARIDEALERKGDPPAVPPLPDPTPREPMLLDHGRWYVIPARDDRVYGIEVRVGSLLEEITAAMRERALLGPEDEVKGRSTARAAAVSSVGLEIASPTWAAATDAAESRYRLKAMVEGIIALLVFGVMGLGIIIYRRRHRFLELKSEFVSAVSHELRTPLASIRLMAETLERRTKDVPRARDYPTRIIRDVDGLSFLVENILSFNRLERGRWVPKPETVALSELVEKLGRDKDSWARRPAALAIGDVDTTIFADPDLLQLVLTNLARNGCQYNERDPAEISVTTEPCSPGVFILVKDNGTGIPEGQSERIFDDFYRAGSAQKTRGSGLGLSICRKIMEAHDGHVRVRETGPDGTTFELYFPALKGTS